LALGPFGLADDDDGFTGLGGKGLMMVLDHGSNKIPASCGLSLINLISFFFFITLIFLGRLSIFPNRLGCMGTCDRVLLAYSPVLPSAVSRLACWLDMIMLG
jgi:hypothetical protein